MIREATTKDFAALIALCRQMYAESARFQRMRFNQAYLMDTFARLEKSEWGFLWVATDSQGDVIGVMAALVSEHWGSPDKMASDLLLYVVPGQRRSGAAGELLQRYVQWARFHSAAIVQVGVTAGIDNAAAVAFYERCGFKACGTLLEA